MTTITKMVSELRSQQLTTESTGGAHSRFGGPNVPMKTKILHVFQSIHPGVTGIDIPVPQETGTGTQETGTSTTIRPEDGLSRVDTAPEEESPDDAVAAFRTQVCTSKTDYIGFDKGNETNGTKPAYFKIDKAQST